MTTTGRENPMTTEIEVHEDRRYFFKGQPLSPDFARQLIALGVDVVEEDPDGDWFFAMFGGN